MKTNALIWGNILKNTFVRLTPDIWLCQEIFLGIFK
jgi:hypothetical protein